jgi:small subunit ribosomal protein S5
MISNSRVRGVKFTNKKFSESVISVRRISKTVTGGRIARFSVCVVVGDQEGHFGIGYGKSKEISAAKVKAINNAKNNLYFCNLENNRTIFHESIGVFSKAKIIIRPSAPGTGIKTSNIAKKLFEIIGIKDISAKSLGSNNPINLCKAITDALFKIQSPEYYKKLETNS